MRRERHRERERVGREREGGRGEREREERELREADNYAEGKSGGRAGQLRVPVAHTELSCLQHNSIHTALSKLMAPMPAPPFTANGAHNKSKKQ